MASPRRYSYQVKFYGRGRGEWQIIDMGNKGYANVNDPAVWTMAYSPEHDKFDEPPSEFREKYEALLRESGWHPQQPDSSVNLVEMIANQDECAWDQPCAYGYRVEDHAVYCHNEHWLYSPRKCRRHRGPSVWGDDPWPHEQCPGFKANPLYKSGRNDE
jgi:hypothetical protein